jgi:hypothetical protein
VDRDLLLALDLVRLLALDCTLSVIARRPSASNTSCGSRSFTGTIASAVIDTFSRVRPFFFELLGERGLDVLGELLALRVQLDERLVRRDGAERVGELALDELADRVLVEAAITERCGPPRGRPP